MALNKRFPISEAADAKNVTSRRQTVLFVICIFLSLVCIGVVIVFMQMKTEDLPGVKHRVTSAAYAANRTKKALSMDALSITKIGGEPITPFISSRMAIVCTGPAVPKVKYGKNVVRNVKVDGAAENAFGLASAVSSDGYFLTAAHCVLDKNNRNLEPVWIIGFATKNHYLSQASVVWLSEEQDLALLRTNIELSKWFKVSEVSPEVSALVIAGGCQSGPGAGELLSLMQIPSAASPHVRVEHNAPLVPGDSGGPLITASGNLIGINYRVISKANLGAEFAESLQTTSYATFVQRDWLQQLMLESSAERSSQ